MGVNPVKAKLVIDASEYRWSSYREYLGVPPMSRRDRGISSGLFLMEMKSVSLRIMHRTMTLTT